MTNTNLEQLLASEMEDVKGGAFSKDTCVCENGGAGAIVIVEGPEDDGGGGGLDEGEKGIGGMYKC